jgi:hypothetical protein
MLKPGSAPQKPAARNPTTAADASTGARQGVGMPQVGPAAAIPAATPIHAFSPPLPAPDSAQPAPLAVPLPAAAAPIPLSVQPLVRPAAAQPARPLPITAATGTAARPVPLSSRPIPVKPGDKPKVHADEAEPGPPDPTEKAVRYAPPWLVSLVVHMVLMIILALIVIYPKMDDTIYIVSEVYAEKLGEQILEDQLQSPDEMNLDIEPVLAFDSKPVEDPFAAPPQLELNILDANTAVSDTPAPSIGLALSGREEGSKRALLAAYGGTATTEAAVRDGLLWLKRNQGKDGSWSLLGPYSDGSPLFENKVAATAMALLAFQGAGRTHKSGEFKDVVARGWTALLKMQNADGFFDCETGYNQRLYAQAQATIALCEIYGMTHDKDFKEPAQRAIRWAINAQSPSGGWRYVPKEDSDMSVTGWYVMALQSAIMGYLEVNQTTLDKVSTFLDSVGREDQSKYAYQPHISQPSLAMTAEGLLCRQYLGWKHDDERLREGVDYLLANKIDFRQKDVYYWYYATQVLHHMDGEYWNEWNQVMRQELPEHQVKTGPEKGSWSPADDEWGTKAGRLYQTCLSIYMLEVYYRHLPIYKYRLR